MSRHVAPPSPESRILEALAEVGQAWRPRRPRHRAAVHVTPTLGWRVMTEAHLSRCDACPLDDHSVWVRRGLRRAHLAVTA